MTPQALGSAVLKEIGLPAMLYTKTRHCPKQYSVRDVVGIIPEFLDALDERGAAEQIDEAYIGGWNPMPGFTFDRLTGALRYGKDAPLYPWVASSLRDELILVYGAGITLIGQEDGSFSVARLD